MGGLVIIVDLASQVATRTVAAQPDDLDAIGTGPTRSSISSCSRSWAILVVRETGLIYSGRHSPACLLRLLDAIVVTAATSMCAIGNRPGRARRRRISIQPRHQYCCSRHRRRRVLMVERWSGGRREVISNRRIAIQTHGWCSLAAEVRRTRADAAQRRRATARRGARPPPPGDLRFTALNLAKAGHKFGAAVPERPSVSEGRSRTVARSAALYD